MLAISLSLVEMQTLCREFWGKKCVSWKDLRALLRCCYFQKTFCQTWFNNTKICEMCHLDFKTGHMPDSSIHFAIFWIHSKLIKIRFNPAPHGFIQYTPKILYSVSNIICLINYTARENYELFLTFLDNGGACGIWQMFDYMLRIESTIVMCKMSGIILGLTYQVYSCPIRLQVGLQYSRFKRKGILFNLEYRWTSNHRFIHDSHVNTKWCFFLVDKKCFYLWCRQEVTLEQLEDVFDLLTLHCPLLCQ